MATLLCFTVLIPLVAACVLALVPGLGYRESRLIALATAILSTLCSGALAFAFEAGRVDPQFAFGSSEAGYGAPWMGSGSVRIAFGLDGLSVWLFALSALLTVTGVCASWESVKEKAAAHYALLLTLETGLLGLFASLDIIQFYVFFEFMLIPMFFLIGIYGGRERRRASITFFLYTLVGSLLALAGLISLVVINYYYGDKHVLTFSIPELTAGLAAIARPEWTGVHPWYTNPQVLIFLLLFAGFAVKVPLFPFHTWLPLAHVEAPTAGSVILAGVMLKVGTYGFLRFNMAMTPLGARVLFPTLAFLSVVGVIYGALTALAQSDVKRLVAYSSVSHMGLIALGLFSATAVGMEGSVIQMVNHGLTTGALFACVGIIYERYHTREMSAMRGLWKRLPLFAFFLILASMGSIALPGLNGFVGEFPILIGAFRRDPTTAVIAATGMILGAYYLLSMVQRVAFGPLEEPAHDDHDASAHADPHAASDGRQEHKVRPVGWHEIVGLAPLMAFIVIIGVYPKPFLDRIVPAIRPIAARFPDSGYRTPSEGSTTALSARRADAVAQRHPLNSLVTKETGL